MRYRRLPEIVDAIQWNGKNFKDIVDFIGGTENRHFLAFHQNKLHLLDTKIEEGDYIIKNEEGEFSFCNSKSFKEDYEEV